AVALLGDPLDLVERAHGLHAEAQEGDAELAPDAHDLAHVGGELPVRAVDGRTLLARQLELRARLERDRGAVARERHDVAVLLLRLPVVALVKPAQDGLDAAPAGERRRLARRALDRDLLVLRADLPALARPARTVELLDELVDRLDGDGLCAGLEVGHLGRRTL